MKKPHGLRRALLPMEREKLEGMTTRALLARLRRLRWCEEGRDTSDITDEEIAAASHLILFKTDPAWRSAYGDVREVLATREHLSNKL